MASISFKTVTKTSHVIVRQPSRYDERDKNGKVKSTHQLQYVQGLNTLDVIEQKKIMPDSVPDPIYINKGIITIDEDDIYKLEFFRKHQDNVANGGNLFKEIDVLKDEIYELEGYEKLDKARVGITEADDNEVRAMAMWFLGEKNIKDPINKIKIILRQKVETDPKFVGEINNFIAEKTSDEKLTITIAINNDILKIVDGRKVAWADTNEAIYVSSQANDVLRNMSVWLRTDEDGREYAKLIAEKIKELKKSK